MTQMNEMLMAAFDEDESFMGLLLSAQGMLFTRDSGSWHVMPSGSRFYDGAEVVEVEQEFMDLYDKLASKGKMPTYKQAHAFEVESPDESTAEVEETPEPEEEVEVE